jgi:AGZA family xanthine/uracil permease-like MFS transporter
MLNNNDDYDVFNSSPTLKINLLNDDFTEVNNNVLIENNHNKIFLYIDNFFKISEKGSTIKTEIYAGIVNFLSMSYILACNPTILAVTGININYVSSGTALASFIGTFMVGIFGNAPIGCAPGIGLSAYFSYSVASDLKNYNLGFLFIFLSGFIVFFLTLFNIPPYILNNIIPKFIKLSTIVGMGLFLSLIGLTEIGLVVKGSGDTLLKLGDLTDWKIWLFLFNIILITLLDIKKIHGSIILSIIITSLLYFFINQEWPTEFISLPHFNDITNILNQKNFELLIELPISKILNILFSFIMVIILDVGGVIFAITQIGNLEKNKITKWALISTSFSTMCASILGCSPIIVHCESIAGVIVGGRTGLTSITTSLFFLLSLILTNFFQNLPLCSTTSITIFIGALMIQQSTEINWKHKDIALSAFLTIIMMPFTFSISYGIYFGLGSYFIFCLFKKENWYKIAEKIYIVKKIEPPVIESLINEILSESNDDDEFIY